MTLQKQSITEKARRRLQQQTDEVVSIHQLLLERQERLSRPRLSLSPIDSFASAPVETAASASTLPDTFGKSASEIREEVEASLPEPQPGPVAKGFSAVTGVVGAGLGLAGRGIGTALSPVGAVLKPVGSAVLDALEWYSDNITAPLGGPVAAAVQSTVTDPIGNWINHLKGSTRTTPRETGWASYTLEMSAEYSRRAAAGTPVETFQDKLSAWHAASRNFQEKQGFLTRILAEGAADPLVLVPFGKIPIVARVATKLDPIAAITRGMAGGGKFRGPLKLAPRQRVDYAEEVSRDLINNVLSLPLEAGRRATPNDGRETLNRIKSMLDIPDAPYKSADIVPHLLRRNTAVKEELALFKEVMEAGWKSGDEWGFDVFSRSLVKGDEIDSAHLTGEILSRGLNAYARKVGYKVPVHTVVVSGTRVPKFPTATQPTVPFKTAFKTEGLSDKDIIARMKKEFDNVHGSAEPEVWDLETIDAVKEAAQKFGVDISVTTETVTKGIQNSPLYKLGMGFKKQISPLLLFLNPGYLVANPISNYGFTFMRHGLGLLNYQGYQKAIIRNNIPLGKYAQEGFGMSLDALGRLSKQADDTLPWVERIPVLGHLPKMMREWQQGVEMHSHQVHMVTTYGKTFRKVWGQNLQDLKLPPEVASLMKHAQGQKDVEKLLSVGLGLDDYVGRIPFDEIRSPAIREALLNRFETISQGSIDVAARPVTDTDVVQELTGLANRRGAGGIDRESILRDVAVIRGDHIGEYHPINDVKQVDNALTAAEPDLAELTATAIADLKAAKGELTTTHAKHIEENIIRRANANSIIQNLQKQKNELSVGNMALARINAQALRAAELSTSASEEFLLRMRAVGADPESIKNLRQELFKIRKNINDTFTSRVEDIANDYKNYVSKLPDAQYTTTPGQPKIEDAEVRRILQSHGLGEVDPTVPENIEAQVIKILDDEVEDLQKAIVGFKNNIAAAAPATVPAEFHEGIKRAFADAHTHSQRLATMLAEHDLFNYGHKTSADLMANIFAPYPFWSTRFLLAVGTRVISKPQHFEQFARIVKIWYEDTKDLPPNQWFTAKLVTLPDGTELRFRPWQFMFPLGYPAMEILKKGSDPTTVLEVSDLIEAAFSVSGMNLYPYWQMAFGVGLPSQVEEAGFGLIKPPDRVLKDAFPLVKTFKTLLGGLPDDKVNAWAIDFVFKRGLLTEADFNRAINEMRIDAEKGLFGPIEKAQPAIDDAAERYRTGELTDLMARYLAKQFAERELWKQIPSVLAVKPEDKARYAIIRNAYLATEDGIAPSFLDKQVLNESNPYLFVGGRWKLPEKLPLEGRVRTIWEQTNDYQYSVANIEREREDLMMQLIDQEPIGPEFVKRLQLINGIIKAKREEARRSHPLAAIKREDRESLRLSLGKVPTPVHPLDVAYEEYIDILTDPQWTDLATGDVDYNARELELEKWKQKHANVSATIFKDTPDEMVATAEQYRQIRQDNNVPDQVREYYDFIQDVAGPYFAVVEQLPEPFRKLLDAAKKEPALYRGDRRLTTINRLLEQLRNNHRRRYLAENGPALEIGLELWFGRVPLWE